MLLDYANARTRRTSRLGIASFTIALMASLATIYWLGHWLPPFNLAILNLCAATSVVCGTVAVINRRRFWWLGLAGLTMGAMMLGMMVYFVLTFQPPVK